MSDRHAFRAKWHDYNAGIYFITICTHEKRHIFGHISHDRMLWSPLGKIADSCIREISSHHNDVEIWNHVIMPNHIHAVIAVGAQYIAPETSIPNIPIAPETPASPINVGCLKPPCHGGGVECNHFNSALAVVVRTFKAAVSRKARAQSAEGAQCIAPLRVWQRNYHEHIIRNQRALDNILNYIDNNVVNWHEDRFFC